MKKYLLIPLFLIVFATTVIAASIDVSINPTTATPGSDLKLTVKTSDVPDGKWAVAYEVDIKGGCTRGGKTKISGFTLNDVGEDKTDEYTIKAPSTEGACTFDIEYQFANGNPKTTKLTAEIKTPEPAQPTTPQQPQQPAEPPQQEPRQPVVETEPQEGGMSNTGIAVLIIAIVIIIGIVIYFVKSKKK